MKPFGAGAAMALAMLDMAHGRLMVLGMALAGTLAHIGMHSGVI